MENINFKHSIIFFNFCILISPLYLMLNFEPVTFCLFLILILGISHGALDNIKGKKLLKLFGYKQTVSFYLIYLLISSLIIIFWLIFPNTILLLFLIVAAYHFGKEDTVFKINIKGIKKDILFLIKGSSIIIAPLLFNFEKTNEIFLMLNFDLFDKIIITKILLTIILILSFISGLILSNLKNVDYKSLTIMDFISIILLNYFLNPILAFTIYFCLLHSIRHSLTLIFELDSKFSTGLEKFAKKALPLTFMTALIYLLSIYNLSSFYELNNAIYKVIFIGLASLTFPHILLEYLIEKNEK